MAHDIKFDRILAALALPLAGHSDILLDLRQWVTEPARAGSCVKAYFELVGAAPECGRAGLQLVELKAWLENHLNILVLDARQSVCLEKLPLALADETDLSEFCHGTMRRLRQDRCHSAPEIRLEFRFASEDPAKAA